MTTRERINEYFNSRAFMVLSALALVVTAVMAWAMGVKPAASGGSGIFFTLDGELMGNSALSVTLNVLCLLVTGGMMLALNKVFNYVRAVTHLFVSAFFLLQLAHPASLVTFNAGTMLSLVAAVSAMPLFAAFQDKHSQRRIFLLFALATAGAMFHYGFLALIPAFLLGFLNMGVLNLKGMLAMLFGLITPFWIVLGLGIASPADFVAPQFHGIWHQPGDPAATLLLVLTALTSLLGIVLAVVNLFTIINYRVQTRVYNAFFVFVLVSVIMAICLDYGDVAFFLPLLNLMVAVQIAHVHTLHATHGYRYIFILLLIATCIAFAVANVFMP